MNFSVQMPRLVSVAVFALLLSACTQRSEPRPEDFEAAPAISSTAQTMPTRPAGQVAPGFQIQISNATDDKLNGTFQIGMDDTLQLPYDIVVGTTGLNEKQLSDRIVKAYRNFFQADPTMQIAVKAKEYWVSVGGLVEKPGQYIVKDSASLDEVIALAGGLLKPTKEGGTTAEYVRISQLGKSMMVKLSDYYSGDTSLIPRWIGGDRLFFQSERGDLTTTTGIETNYVQILGQVKSPGEYSYRGGADFFHYLVRAGGPTDRADLGNVMILRADGSQNRSLSFTAEDRDQPLPTIRGGDVVIVHADNPSRAQKQVRFIGDIAAVFSALATVALLFTTI